MLHIDIITLFPDVITAYARESILGRAQKNKLLQIRAHQLREYSIDKKHHKVDDTPYGGGAGMVMMVQPFDDAVADIRLRKKLFSRTVPSVRVVLTSASGKTFTQHDARRLAAYDQVIFLCGRYEGVDARVVDLVADEELSIGDYVLTGGELPALVMADAMARMIPGVLGNTSTLDEESHTTEGFLEYPQYTKPELYKGIAVPPVLLSGNHRAIEKWRKMGK
jgi:tRNA (guanine37-N1)-methyltransferase